MHPNERSKKSLSSYMLLSFHDKQLYTVQKWYLPLLLLTTPLLQLLMLKDKEKEFT
jgi:hypothetical protein